MTVTANKIKLVSDRVERAKSLLLSQFKDSPNINALVEVLVSELQELENTLNDVQTVRTLDGSYGVFLDEIGRQLKVGRNGYSDNDYKTAIKIAMFKRTASATLDDIQRIVELLSGDPEAVLTNNYPYFMELTSYLFCVGESQEGLELIGNLFPTNTAIKINKRFGRSFGFGADKGFGSGATINSLVYTKYGLERDPRFTSSATPVIPPTLPVAPNNTTPPVVTGLNEIGSTLTVSNGTWVGDEPISYSYQWLKNDSPISGQTTNSYIIVEVDLGSAISCEVTATNTVAFSSALSNVISVEEVLPPEQEITDGLGITDVYVLRPLRRELESGEAIARIDFNTDGTIVLSRITDITAADIVNSQYLVTAGVGAGADYTISYTTISGGNATGLLPNVTYNLGTARFMQVSVSGDRSIIGAGTYAITVRSIPNPTISKTVTITLTAEVGEFF